MLDSRYSRLKWIAAALLLAAALCAVYAPALQGSYLWDDNLNFTENATVRDAAGLREIWLEPTANYQYYPLTFTSYWVEYRFFGYRPFVSHLVNVLLHTLNSLLVWMILRRLSVPGAALAALIFAFHPVHAESVAWVTERKNVLSGFLYFSAILAFLKAWGIGPGGADAEGEGVTTPVAWLPYMFGMVLFLLALAAKSATLTLPAALLLILWWKQERLSFRSTLPLVPMILAGSIFAVLTRWMEARLGAQGEDYALSAIERLLAAGRAFWFYLVKLLLPAKLTFIYPKWIPDASRWEHYLYPLCALVLLAALFVMRKRIGRGPVTALLYFFITLLPVLGLVDFYFMRYSLVADHLQYLAAVGPVALFSALLARPFRARPDLVRPALAASSCLLLFLGSMTWGRAQAFTDEETLWLDTLAKNDEAFMAHNNLGRLYLSQGRHEEAVPHLHKALIGNPGAENAHNNLGIAYGMLGRHEEAKRSFSRAIAAEPALAAPWFNLGRLYILAGQTEEALHVYSEGVRRDPGNAAAHTVVGTLSHRLGRRSEALASYRRAVALRPKYAEARFNLALLHADMGNREAALEEYRALRSLDGGRARELLAHIEE